MLKILILLGIFIFVSPLKADASLLILDDQVESVNLSSQLEILEDQSQLLSLPHLLKNHTEFALDWRPLEKIEYTLSAWWIRFEVVNTNSNDRYWYLQLQDFDSTSLQVYTFPPEFAASPRLIPSIDELRQASFRLELPQSEKFWVYLRVSNSNQPLVFDLRLLTADALVKATPRQHIFYAFVLGGLLVLSVYNLLTFLNLKELSYLSLAVFIFSNFVGLSSQTGMLSLMLSHTHVNPNADYLHVVFSMLTIASGNSFFYNLMSISKHLPFWANLFKVHFWLSIFVALIINFIPFQLFYPSFFGTTLLMFATPILWKLYKIQIPEAKSFFWAFMVILFSCIPILLFGFGFLIDRVLALKLFTLGFLMFGVLLSLNQSTRTRELREQAQQITASSKDKDAFLMNISHELRTPMHAVVSSGTLLSQTQLSPQQSDYVEKLQASAQHMLNLINNILDVSRLNHTKLEVIMQSFDLQEVLSNLDKLLGDRARQKGLAFSLQNKYSAQNLLIGDPMCLSQVLLNLLDNAIKFTEQGSVSLVIEPMGQWLSKIELQFKVIDTGIGLSLPEQERLFEPFFQANSNINRRHMGTGLGLTISQNLVQHLGGILEVESELGQGSCFFFKLAFSLAEQPSNPYPVKLFTIPPSYSDKKILLVDDDALNQFFGKELLIALGANVEIAVNGELALSKLKKAHYDLVFMDVSMPDLDGYQTTQLIRNDLGLTTLPIVALTAHAIAGERERCLAAGMNDYLAKPFSIQALNATLARWLINFEDI